MTFTMEMALALLILGIAIFLFVTELFRIDVSAILIMLMIGAVSYLPGITPLLEPSQLFSGFSSNAVLSIIAIMIIGSGLEKTGLMTQTAIMLLNAGQQTERRIVARMTLAIGLISAFMQNVGATALFLPVVSRVANHTGIPLSRLLIPVGFCAILGGTLTMVGCSSLILLNDLIASAQDTRQPMLVESFKLFDVTPIGIVLLLAGITFFSLFGKFLLPDKGTHLSQSSNTAEYLTAIYGLKNALYEVEIPANSPVASKTIRQIEDTDKAPQILSFRSGTQIQISPNRDDIVWPGSTLLVLGAPEDVEPFTARNGLTCRELPANEVKLMDDVSGLSEVVIPPGSQWIGHSAGEIRLRKHYNASLIGIYRGTQTLRENLRGVRLCSGDTLLLYSRWSDLAKLAKNRDFVVASDFPKSIVRPEKLPYAIACFVLAMTLVLFSDVKLSFALLTGALGMVICGVINMDEAYQSVSWKTVFLLASLIPMGIALNQSGTAEWLAIQILSHSDNLPTWVIQSLLAVLATGFTLIMSNVGATVLLVPIGMSLAIKLGASPALFAITIALATSNSFLIPTHQVNALIMGPAGYRVADFIRVGGIMTVLYLLILIPATNFFIGN